MRDQVFISYSHADAKWLTRLKTHLKPLIRRGEVSAWSDQQIKPGTHWREEIASAIGRARVAVLLVTPEFLASDFIAEKELPPLLAAAHKDGVTILWIAIKASSILDTELAPYQGLNDPGKPLAQVHHAHQDAALVGFCKVIREAYSKQGIEQRQALAEFACEQVTRRSDEIRALVADRFSSLHFSAKDDQGRTVGASFVSVGAVRLTSGLDVMGSKDSIFTLSASVEVDYEARVAYVQSAGYKEPPEPHVYTVPNTHNDLVEIEVEVNSLRSNDVVIGEVRLKQKIVELEYW